MWVSATRQHGMSDSLKDSRDFVKKAAIENIKSIRDGSRQAKDAHEVNLSLGIIANIERTMIMDKALDAMAHRRLQ